MIAALIIQVRSNGLVQRQRHCKPDAAANQRVAKPPGFAQGHAQDSGSLGGEFTTAGSYGEAAGQDTQKFSFILFLICLNHHDSVSWPQLGKPFPSRRGVGHPGNPAANDNRAQHCCYFTCHTFPHLHTSDIFAAFIYVVCIQ